MKRRALLIVLFAAAMLLAAVPLAWADSTSGAVSSSVYNPYRQQILQELQTLQGLQQTCANLDQQLKTQTQTNLGLLQQMKNAATGLTNQIQPVRQQNKQLRSTIAGRRAWPRWRPSGRRRTATGARWLPIRRQRMPCGRRSWLNDRARTMPTSPPTSARSSP